MASKHKAARKTKKDLMVELLREAILAGALAPGERLLQEELADRFDVSPTPVREAIQQLVAEGVLSHSPYRGVQVAEVDLEDVQEIYLIRAVLEGLATRLAVPNLKISDLQRLHTLQDEIRGTIARGEIAPIRKLNYDFHMRIYTAAEAPQLFQMVKGLWVKAPWDTLYVIPGRPVNMLEEHQLIINAISKGDAVLAGQYMQSHIEIVRAALTKFLSEKEGLTPQPE
jgi:DNA-binding GntR family transcriptional regulator